LSHGFCRRRREHVKKSKSHAAFFRCIFQRHEIRKNGNVKKRGNEKKTGKSHFNQSIEQILHSLLHNERGVDSIAACFAPERVEFYKPLFSKRRLSKRVSVLLLLYEGSARGIDVALLVCVCYFQQALAQQPRVQYRTTAFTISKSECLPGQSFALGTGRAPARGRPRSCLYLCQL
jgi:hypothetical protein